MAKKARSRFVDYSVYLIVRALCWTIQRLPVACSLWLARSCGWIAFRLGKSRRRVAAENLRHAYPDLSEVEIERRVRAMFRHIFTVLFETIILSRKLNRHTVQQYVSHACPDEYQRSVALAQSQRPVIMLTGHLGNWEVLSFALAIDGEAGIVARPLDNPYLNQFLRGLRSSKGIRILDKLGALQEVEENLALGGNLGAVADQSAGERGMYVDFLGRSASTHKSIALLAIRYQAVILVLGCARTGLPLQHEIWLEDEIPAEEYQDDPNAVRAITERFTVALERMVRRYPDQYFWLHKRWKHQPRLSLSDALTKANGDLADACKHVGRGQVQTNADGRITRLDIGIGLPLRAGVTDDDLPTLARQSELEELGLQRSRISDAGLAHLQPLSQLRSLRLAETRLTDRCIEFLKALPSLEVVDLKGTKVTEAGLKALADSRPQVQVLR